MSHHHANLVTDMLQTMKDHSRKADKHKDKQQQDLYRHLCTVLNELPQLHSEKINAFQHIERISEYYKKNKINHKEPLSEEQLNKIIKKEVEYPAWIAKQEKIVSPNADRNTKNRIIQNYQAQNQNLFRKIGISLGEQESIRITFALKKLAQKQNALNLRFWGKILTRNGDYLIIQGFSKKQILPEVSGDQQKYREGANYNSYWVNHDSISEEWYQLPLVTPQQIRTSKLVKYAFTGNLQSPIKSFPAFDGQEKHFLKAQLVRITHNCEIVPKGMYNSLEDNPDQIDFAEEFKMPDFAELTNLQNWIHLNPYILNLGRASYYVDPKLSEEQKQQALAKLGEKDPKIQRLKAINEDKPVQKMGFEGCWIAKVNGNTQLFNNVGKQEGTTSCYGVVSLRNPNWPGWITAANSKMFGSIYIGYGIKATQPSFDPLGPDDVMIEGEDIQQFDEPNPKNPPDELQPDSDDEGKKPEE